MEKGAYPANLTVTDCKSRDDGSIEVTMLHKDFRDVPVGEIQPAHFLKVTIQPAQLFKWLDENFPSQIETYINSVARLLKDRPESISRQGAQAARKTA